MIKISHVRRISEPRLNSIYEKDSFTSRGLYVMKIINDTTVIVYDDNDQGFKFETPVRGRFRSSLTTLETHFEIVEDLIVKNKKELNLYKKIAKEARENSMVKVINTK